jgi:hypothetical protein
MQAKKGEETRSRRRKVKKGEERRRKTKAKKGQARRRRQRKAKKAKKGEEKGEGKGKGKGEGKGEERRRKEPPILLSLSPIPVCNQLFFLTSSHCAIANALASSAWLNG